VTESRLLELLRLLLPAHSPGGDEGEIDAILLPRFRDCLVDVEQDGAGNIVGRLPGRGEAPPLLVAAHKDELGLIVKRVESDGSLRVQEIGGVTAWKYGEGMMDILADSGIVPGVMSVGSMHTSAETTRVEYCREHPMDWSAVRIETRRSPAELDALGVFPGTRVLVARHRKQPILWNDCVCGYAIDDKAAVALMMETARELAAGPQPPQDIYFAATAMEEQVCGAASVLAGRLPVDTFLALEIGPVAEEYGLRLDDRPIVWYKDRITTYTKSFCDDLVAVGRRLGFGCQRAVYTRGATDASAARQAGTVGRVAVLSHPTMNSHGYEVAPIGGILNMQRLLVEYLR
jgi:putative aminopeptidase FrvX